MTDVLDVLIAARAEVEKGWCRIDIEDKDGNVCALGAVQVVHGMPRDVHAAYLMTWPEVPVEVTDALDAAIPDDCTWVTYSDQPHKFMAYNDGRSKADVLALFDRAIAAEAVKVTADPSHVYAVQA